MNRPELRERKTKRPYEMRKSWVMATYQNNTTTLTELAKQNGISTSRVRIICHETLREMIRRGDLKKEDAKFYIKVPVIYQGM